MFGNATEGELAMLLDLPTAEKEIDSDNLLHRSYSEDLDPNSAIVSFSCSEPNNNGGCSPISKNVSSVPPRKTRTEDFMDSENEKSDYDWLLTPPGTPLFPSMETESQKSSTNKNDTLNSRSTALKPRLVNIQEESDTVSNIASKHHPNLQSGQQLNSSCASNRRPSSKASAATASRSATPTSRATLSKNTKPSRSATPTSRVSLASVKPALPPARSSTPGKTTARSSTPTERSVSTSKQISRSATPNRCPSKPTCPSIVSRPTGRPSSTSKFSARSSSNPRPSRGTFPSIKPRPSKPSEVPNIPLDAAAHPLPERPASATKGRPVAVAVVAAASSSAKSSSVRTMSNGKTRQKPSSPSKQLASNGSSGKIFPFKQRIRSSDDNEVSPVVMGTKMVERVVNMRKLAPPKQGDRRSSNGDPASKPSAADISGFGRTLSNKSLDMALRHMDITRSVSVKVRPVVTKTPASSMDNANLRSAKFGTIGAADSPLATSSNSSSAPSACSSSIRLDGSETEDNDDLAAETASS